MTALPKMVPVQQVLIQTISSKMLNNHGTTGGPLIGRPLIGRNSHRPMRGLSILKLLKLATLDRQNQLLPIKGSQSQ